ncbi:O-methyltransferase [Haloarchaeobius sp. HRN-SO-5]|uniref:O-methyltransferase n=1 Tax=Haloarchaeobius sp. HRN-SO-5 TaxID=3446118 RepID=UPI003EB76BC3
MDDVIPAETARFVRAMAPEADETVAAMEAYGETHGPTTVGREVGQLCRLLTELTGAERVFEFGSGYGYSGYWFVLGGAAVVLTDVEEENVAQAEEFYTEAGVADRATFTVGDAHDVVADFESFDVVFIDHQKSRYRDAFDAVRDRVNPGGLVVADNAMVSTSIQFDGLLATLEGREAGDLNDSTAGVADYLTTVRDDRDFETVVLPIGEGVAVSRKTD